MVASPAVGGPVPGPLRVTIPAPEQDLTVERAAFLEAVLEGLQEGVFVARDERILEVNQALCDLFGFDREELLGATLPFPFFPPDGVEQLSEQLQRLREAGSGEQEMILMRKDGTRVPVLISAGRIEVEGRYLGRVVTVRDISERREREDQLVELAVRDQLTGLFNKRSFLTTLTGEVARARRHGRPLTLAILDLDGFKAINDKNGHQVGDLVLAEAAGRLAALVRTGEHMARVGGDEFGWILPDADRQGATAAVQRARAAISGEAFLRGLARLTLSGGLCQTNGALDADELYRRADRALYAAKTAGGDTIRSF